MAVIHLDLDIDSDVYPELHAMLAAMGSSAARGERLRQLAATGLIWEECRAKGQYTAPSQPLSEAAALRASGAAAAAPSKRTAAPKGPPRGRGKGPSGGNSGFVDLAINAPPSRDDGQQPQDRADGLDEHAEIPLLFDVVSPQEAPRLIAAVKEPAPVPVSVKEGHKIIDTEPERKVRALEDDASTRVEAVLPLADDPDYAAAVPQKAVKRPRLMRMKERGLFRNG